MSDSEKSFLCDECSGDPFPRTNSENFKVTCPNCGEYEITGTLTKLLPNWGLDKKKLLSIMVRRYWENNKKRYCLDSRNEKELIDSYDSFSFKDKINNMLNYIGSNSKPGKKIIIKSDMLFITPSIDREEVVYILEYLVQEKKLIPLGIKKLEQERYKLTVDGWESFFEDDRKINPKKCFIAMSFRDEEKDAKEDYEEVVKPLLIEMGFDPVIINEVEHNEDVVFKIIYEIKRCGFMIADVRGERPSVYYEAGYATALGRQVIWLCKKGNEDIMHFDTRNLNHIIWKNREDLKEKLESRIMGTILI